LVGDLVDSLGADPFQQLAHPADLMARRAQQQVVQASQRLVAFRAWHAQYLDPVRRLGR
jgi:hypothetical protein